MVFDANLVTTDKIAKITLSGELDAASASAFKEKIEAAAKQDCQRLVLLMRDLQYMASAGLRVLIFAKQKMGPAVGIYVVEAQEMVLETIEQTGFHHSVTIMDQYDSTQIETL